MSLEESLISLTNEIKRLINVLNLNYTLLQGQINKPEPPAKKIKALNEAEAAKYIGMSRSFLAQDRMNGHRETRTKGPTAIKAGRKILYEIDELDAWLKANRR